MRCALIVAAYLAVAARGDVLYLKSGEAYTGTFVSGNKNWIHFTTDARVRQSFRTREVDRIEFGAPAAEETTRNREATPAQEQEEVVVPVPAATPPPAQPAVIVPPAEAEAAMAPPFPLATPTSDFGIHTPPDSGAINAVYTALGGPTGALGNAQSVEKWTPDHRAVVRYYAGGDIYWTEQGGAHAIMGPLRTAWLELGGPASRLGYPIGDEQDAEGGYSRTQKFEGGRVTWTAGRGAVVEYR